MTWMATVWRVPEWLRHYPEGVWKDDVLAGLMVSVLVIPQSLAYALLAGLPPQVGLYVSILPALAYAWWGSSRVQAVGPVAITAIMTYTVLSPLAPPGSPAYAGLAAALSLMSGLLVLACGMLRLGFLSQLLSRPVSSGFISGSAVLIVFSQLKHVLGVPVQAGSTWVQLQSLWQQLPQVHGPTAAIGGAALALLVWARHSWAAGLVRLGFAHPRAAFVARLAPLLVVAVAAWAVAWGDWDTVWHVRVVGHIEPGLPVPQLFWPDAGAWQSLLLPAAVLTLVGMVQNISMAQALAIKRGERVDANAELVGLGAANVVAAFHGGMPVGGGVSRSAVNVASGAQTPLATVVAALSTVGLLLWATPWLQSLPLAVLGASIMLGAWSLIDVSALRQAWRYDRADALAWLGTALGVLFLGLDVGIALGVLFSMGTLLFHASQPHIAVVGRLPGTEHFRNVDRHQTETLPAALFVRIDESLFFGNLAAIENRLRHELTAHPGTRDVVLVMNAVNHMDSTAVEVLSEFNRDLRMAGVALHLAEVKGPVQDRLQATPLWQKLSGRVFLSANEAFEALQVHPTGHRLP